MAEPKEQPPAHWAGTVPQRILAPDGTAVGDPDVGLDPAGLRELLRWMVLARRLDRECIALQRQGELTVYPGFEGQEAAQIGSATALASNGFRVAHLPRVGGGAACEASTRSSTSSTTGARGTAARTTRAPLASVRSASRSRPRSRTRPATRSGSSSTASDVVSIAYFGDGATSEGDFHEAANLAGVWRLPLVLFCQNNGWAISVPTAKQTAGEIWRRAEGYGFPGVRVDGNDVLAVYAATREALERARRGDGPTLIEAMTYRIGAHSTADDAGRYRADPDVEAARAFDPIARFRTWLVAAGHADDAFVAACEPRPRRSRSRSARA